MFSRTTAAHAQVAQVAQDLCESWVPIDVPARGFQRPVNTCNDDYHKMTFIELALGGLIKSSVVLSLLLQVPLRLLQSMLMALLLLQGSVLAEEVSLLLSFFCLTSCPLSLNHNF